MMAGAAGVTRGAARSTPPLLAYVLHKYDWSESSLIVELFTRAQGRIVVVAKGAKRPTSQLRPVLLPFQRLHAQLGKVPAGEMSERTRMLMTYALCGFANIGSVGITVTGLSVLMPERREEVLGMVWKALFAGFLATLMTAAIVGAMPATMFR